MRRQPPPVTRAWWEHAAQWSRVIVGSALAASVALVAVIRLTPKEMTSHAGSGMVGLAGNEAEAPRAAFELAVIGRVRTSPTDVALMPSAVDLLIPVGTGGVSR